MNGRNDHSRRAGRRTGPALAVLLAAMTVAACDLDSILEVEIPGKVLEASLDNPALAAVLVRSVLADVECSWNNYAAGAAIHSDEYIPTSGNAHMRDWGSRKITEIDAGFAISLCGDWGFPMYQPLQTARFQAEDVFRRLSGTEFADVPNITSHRAQVRMLGAFPLIAMGEGFCETSIPETEGTPGPLVTPARVLAIAESRLSEAITLAGQAGNAAVLNAARVARARVRLNLGNYAGAIADAAEVPAGFILNASRDESIPRRFNYYFERMNARDGFRQHGSIADHYRGLTIAADGRPTRNDGVPDRRVNAQTTGALAADFATIHWFHDKYTSRASPVPMASYKEARLIIAEAAVRTNDLDRARSIINARRTELGLPTFNLPATQAEMLRLVIEERRRDLFVEGGHRLNDMLRLRGTPLNIPFLGEPGSIHPNGRDQTGAEYGTTTCLPLPVMEKLNNPNIRGS
jgi:hypothetical protein